MHYSQLSGFALTTRLYSTASDATDRGREIQTPPDIITDSMGERGWSAKILRRFVVGAGVRVVGGCVLCVCVCVVEWGVAAREFLNR